MRTPQFPPSGTGGEARQFTALSIAADSPAASSSVFVVGIVVSLLLLVALAAGGAVVWRRMKSGRPGAGHQEGAQTALGRAGSEWRWGVPELLTWPPFSLQAPGSSSVEMTLAPSCPPRVCPKMLTLRTLTPSQRPPERPPHPVLAAGSGCGRFSFML